MPLYDDVHLLFKKRDHLRELINLGYDLGHEFDKVNARIKEIEDFMSQDRMVE